MKRLLVICAVGLAALVACGDDDQTGLGRDSAEYAQYFQEEEQDWDDRAQPGDQITDDHAFLQSEWDRMPDDERESTCDFIDNTSREMLAIAFHAAQDEEPGRDDIDITVMIDFMEEKCG